LSAAQPLSVGTGDVSGIVVDLRPGGRLTGRVTFEGTSPRPAGDRLRQVSVSIEPLDGRGASSLAFINGLRGQIDANGNFKTYRLPNGRYLIRPPVAPSGWVFKSAIVDGRDISDTPLELAGADVDGLVLTFTDRPTTLSGTARDAKGAGDPTATVLIFPVDRARWIDTGPSPRRITSVRAALNGGYRFPRLPAGDYYLVALPEEDTIHWQDPVRLEALARLAIRVTLSDGETKVQDLATTSIR
jgi:hypothetical protein